MKYDWIKWTGGSWDKTKATQHKDASIAVLGRTNKLRTEFSVRAVVVCD